MTNRDLHEEAQALADCHSGYALARMVIELRSQVPEVKEIGNSIQQLIEPIGNDKAAIQEKIDAALTRRDLIKQAEALEKIYNESQGCMIINRGSLLDESRSLRQQANQLEER